MKSINSGTRRAPGQISFIFHAVFGKNFGKKGGLFGISAFPKKSWICHCQYYLNEIETT